MTILFKFCATPPKLPIAHWTGPEKAHPARLAAHTASKLALSQAFREFSLLCPRSPIDQHNLSDGPANHQWWVENREQQLREKSFYCLEFSPDTLISRAHTEAMTVAAVAELGLGVRSIGIDIEALERELKPELSKIFLSKSDQTGELSHLEVWSAKEASFKAISSFMLFHARSLPKPLTLKDIELEADQKLAGSFRFKDFEGRFNGLQIDLSSQKYLVFTASLFA